jgi:DNA-binding transcriptional regulator LsrR (DeoR family)
MPKVDPDEPRKLARVARDYYINGYSQSDIAKKMGRNQSTVAMWLRRARERGVASVDIDPDFALSGIEHRERSRELRDRSKLRECLVVDKIDPALSADDRSNELHTVIANTSGIRLREWIQSGDHIVVGGGRAPVRVARFIKRTPPARSEVRISPLSGRIWTGAWQQDGRENLQRPLDADDAARLLGFAFENEPGTRFSQIGHPLYADSPSAARRTIEEECVFRPDTGWNVGWGLQAPVRALVGVGVLHPASGHRLSEFLKTKSGGGENHARHHLGWAALKCKEALQFVSTHKLPYFGDVANRLFPALPLPHEFKARKAPSPELFNRLGALLDELNRRAVVMGWGHLKGIPSVWAVAGGELKARVLWTLVICRYLDEKSSCPITELSTDIRTAETLLKALRDYEKAPDAVKDFYKALAPAIFRSPAGVE